MAKISLEYKKLSKLEKISLMELKLFTSLDYMLDQSELLLLNSKDGQQLELNSSIMMLLDLERFPT